MISFYWTIEQLQAKINENTKEIQEIEHINALLELRIDQLEEIREQEGGKMTKNYANCVVIKPTILIIAIFFAPLALKR